MKAITYSVYGSPDVLRCEEVERPAPGDDEVLIAVRAVSVNPLDWHSMRGEPYFLRLATGLRRPKVGRLGVDVAGRVEAVGKNVAQLRAGDEVFGGCRGAFAEFACAPAAAVAAKPARASFAQAAAVPVAGITALQGLRDSGRIRPGQEVLVHGAAGGVGTFAVQIARSFGAVVTGVCSGTNVEMVRSLGAARAIDYTRDDFTREGRRYDLILDCVGDHPLPALRRALHREGTYVAVGGSGGRWLGPLPRILKAVVGSWFSRPRMTLCMARQKPDDLVRLCELVEAGKLTPVVDERHGLAEIPAAIRYLETGHARGKVVITL